MKRKVAIIGANGQLGSDLVHEFGKAGYEVESLTHSDISVEDVASVRQALNGIKPHVVLNTAAFHNVPKCEDESTKAYQVNGLGALNVARVCDAMKIRNVYFSTDYVFDGNKRAPYIEADRPNPLNVYASTKLLGEYFTLNYSPKSFVVRVSGIYGRVPCRAKGGNFISTMVRLASEKPEVKVVQDEILTPTPTSEIAAKVVHLVETDAYDIYHLTSEGECSWYDFARVIFDRLRLKTPLYPTSVKEFASPVNRPYYSVLENKKWKEVGLRDMPHWEESLVSFLKTHYQ